ncbi:MAG: oxygenase MpaB family protein [Pseudomonadota bacterium]
MTAALDVSKLPPLGITPRFAELQYLAPYTEDALQQWRTQGDPLSDRVVAALAAEGSLKNMHDLLGTVREKAARGDADCIAFMRHCNSVPAWADFKAMEKGQRLIASYSPFMGISLFAGSLVGGAVFQKMAMVTAMTGMLSGSATQRLTETTAMVIRMAFPGEIEPGGKSHEVLARVRLLHSAIRRFLVDSGRYSHPTEVPINQQDLAITLGLFGYLNIRGLMQLGIRLDREEIDSFILLWRYAGHVLGIDEKLLPTSIEEQQAFFLASLRHQAKPDKLTEQTKCILDEVAVSANRQARIPYPVAQTFLHQITRYLSGNDYVTGMKIEDKGDYWGIRLFRGLGRTFCWTHRYVPGGERVLYRLGAAAYRRELAKNERKKAYGYKVQTNENAAYKGRRAA